MFKTSVVKSLVVAKKLVQAFVLLIDNKMAKNIELDEVASQFYHAFSQVSKFTHFLLGFISFVIEVLTHYLCRRWQWVFLS